MNELKQLIEKRNEKIGLLEAIVSKAKKEVRAFTEDEMKEYEDLKSEVERLNALIKAIEEKAKNGENQSANNCDTKEAQEERAFLNYIKSTKEERADTNLTYSANGAVIPKTILNKIITKVTEISPLYSMASKYNVKGDLAIPYYDENTDSITVGYADEFGGIQAKVGKLKSIELKGYLASALTLISKQLINNTNIDVLNFVINDMAKKISIWIENQLINGTSGKVQGLAGGVTKTVTTASETAITADELIDLQDSIPDIYQGNACFIMSRKTKTALRKIKDKEGRYIFQPNMNGSFGDSTILGKKVYVSDNMDDMAGGKTAIYYGDFSGLAVKLSEEASIEVLREKYSEQHAIGVNAWLEIDAKVEDASKIAKLVMKSAA